ncbi:PEP-CTERM sorting domain-containing protein [Haloferula sp.]|uniref:PEP-CTERM sorting domain-containing protein n=1 Tax=Haloferula sp. TaxID=2497595 RepID=UPI003C711C82
MRKFNMLAMVALLATPVNAAIVGLTTTDISRTGNYDLSTGSNVDWRFFNDTTGGGNSQLGGAGSISAVTATLTTGITYQVQGSTPQQYNWTDGMIAGVGGASNTGLNIDDALLKSSAAGPDLEGSGANLSFTIVGQTYPQTVSIYGMKLNIGENFTASLNGFSDVDVTGTTAGGTSVAFRTDLTFTALNTGDLLTLTLRGAGSGASVDERVGIQAVTVSGIPEPSAAALLGLGMLGLAARRRRA